MHWEGVAGQRFRKAGIGFGVLDGEIGDDFLETPVLASGKGGEVDEHPMDEALGGEGGDGGVEGSVGAALVEGVGGSRAGVDCGGG